MGILQARILQWVAVPSSGGIFLTQGLNWGLLLGRRVVYHRVTWEAPIFHYHLPCSESHDSQLIIIGLLGLFILSIHLRMKDICEYRHLQKCRK